MPTTICLMYWIVFSSLMIPRSAEVPKLFDVTGKRQGDGSLVRKFKQIVLELFDVGFAQPMQGGHRSILKEVRHDRSNTPLTVAIEQPKKSASLMGLPEHSSIYRNLVVVHYHLRPGGVRRIIELALPHIASAAPTSSSRLLSQRGDAGRGLARRSGRGPARARGFISFANRPFAICPSSDRRPR